MTAPTITPSAPRRAMPMIVRRLVILVSYIWILVALIALWQWHGTRNPSLFIPRPSEIADRFHEVWFSGSAGDLYTTEEFRRHVGASLSRWARAYVTAAVVGVALGAYLARHQRVNWMCQPVIRLAQSTPSIMLLPLVIVLMGINDWMTMTVIVYGSFWPVLVNTIDGVASVDAATINSARALRISGWRLYKMVLMPAASPQILAGLRVALGVSIILMVGSELYAATRGIGYYVMLSQRRRTSSR